MKYDLSDTISYAKDIKETSLKLVHNANASHIGGILSMADILAVLYHKILNVKEANPKWENRDRFLLSKGHNCAGLYSALSLKGFFYINNLI